MILVKKLDLIHLLCLSNVHRENVFADFLEREEACLRRTQSSLFSKGVSPPFSLKIWHLFNFHCYVAEADPGFFLGGGALVSCCTSTPINHIVFFFLQNTSCIRKPQVIQGGGMRTPCTLPLDPPLCRIDQKEVSGDVLVKTRSLSATTVSSPAIWCKKIAELCTLG